MIVHISEEEALAQSQVPQCEYPSDHPLYGRGTQLPNTVVPGDYVVVDGPVVSEDLYGTVVSVSVLRPVRHRPARWLIAMVPVCIVLGTVGVLWGGLIPGLLLGMFGMLATVFLLLAKTGHFSRTGL